MGFNAGEIHASAHLDRTPFSEGLRLAIQEGEEFERRRFTATTDVKTMGAAELDRLEQRLRRFADKKYTAKVDIDYGNVFAPWGFDNIVKKLEYFAKQRYVAKVDLDVTAANAKLDALKVRLGALDTTVTVRVRYRPDPLPPVPVPPGGGPGGSSNGASGGAAGGVGLLPLAILSALPLIGPLAAAGTAALLGTAGAAGTVGLAFLGLREDIKASSQETRPLIAQVDSLKARAMDLGHTAERSIMGGLLGSLRQVRAFLPTMEPTVARVGVGLGNVMQNLTSAVTTTLSKGAPLMVEFVNMLDRGSLSLARFLESEKFSQFLAYAEQELPKVVGALGDLGKATIDIAVALQPAGDKLLSFIDNLARGADEAARLAHEVDKIAHLSGSGGGNSFLGRLQDNLGAIPGKVINPVGNLYGMVQGARSSSGPSISDQMAAAQLKAQEEQILRTKAAIAQLDVAQNSEADTIARLGRQYGLTDKQVAGYAATLGITMEKTKAGQVVLADGSLQLRRYAADVAVVASANRTGTASTMAYLAAVEAFSKSEGTAADRAGLISAALKQANGDLLGYAAGQVRAAEANQTLVSGMDKQTRATINLKTGLIDYRNAAAGPLLANLQALQDAAAKAAGATYQHEQATGKASTAAKHAADQYYAQTHGALIDEASQLGLTKEQATKLADQYFAMPKDVKTLIEAVGTDPVVNVLNQIGKQLSELTGKPWVPTVNANVTPAQQKLHEVQATIRATTGNKTVTVKADVANAVRTISRFLSDPATKVVQVVTVGGPSGPFGGRQVTSAYGNIVKAYGYGGVDDVANNHQPAIYPVRPDRTYRVFAEPETQGEVYAPLANDHRRPKAKAIISEAARIMGGEAIFYDSGGGYGFTNVQGPTSPSSHPGSGTSSAASRAALKANRAIAAGLDTTLFRQLQQLDTLATGTAAHVQAATTTIVTAFRKAFSTGFTDSAMVRSINAETAALNKAVAQRDATHQKLLAANKAVADTRGQMAQVRSDVAGNILSRFDIGTSGNGYQAGILATLTQDRDDARKFAQLRGQAEKLGLDKRLVEQITREGPQMAGRNLEAIVAGGKSYVAQLNTLYGQFDSAAQATGQAQAQANLGAQLARQSQTADKLTKEQTAEQRKINRTLAEIRSDLVALDRKLEAARRGR